MKGIVLSGGSGTRLYPTTLAVSKQLLPVYDKPMIYYSVSLLVMAGIDEILVITRPADLDSYRALLGDGARLGLRISYATQAAPRGIADAFLVGEDFIAEQSCALVLGDNFLHGPGVADTLSRLAAKNAGATLLSCSVPDPERFGIATFDADGRVVDIEEKPRAPTSDQAVIGLYFYDDRVVEVARGLAPSARGEIEITDVNRWYLDQGALQVEQLDDGYTWFDAGTSDSLLDCADFVRTTERGESTKIGCLEEIVFRKGLIGIDRLREAAGNHRGSSYGDYLASLVQGQEAAGD